MHWIAHRPRSGCCTKAALSVVGRLLRCCGFRRAVVTLALVPLFWIGAVGNSSAGAVTIRQDPTLHGLVLVSPYPGWRSCFADCPRSICRRTTQIIGHVVNCIRRLASANRQLQSACFIVLGRLPKGYPPGFRGAPLLASERATQRDSGLQTEVFALPIWSSLVPRYRWLACVGNSSREGSLRSPWRQLCQIIKSSWCRSVRSHYPDLSCSRLPRRNFRSSALRRRVAPNACISRKCLHSVANCGCE